MWLKTNISFERTYISSVSIIKTNLALKIGKPATSTTSVGTTATTSRILIRKGAMTTPMTIRASRATRITIFVSVWLRVTLGVTQWRRTDQLSISIVSCEPGFVTIKKSFDFCNWQSVVLTLNDRNYWCIMMQSYPPRILDRRLQEDWARSTEEGPRVFMNLEVDFWVHGPRLGPFFFVNIRIGFLSFRSCILAILGL